MSASPQCKFPGKPPGLPIGSKENLMSSYLSERLAIVATVDPDAYSAGTYDSDAIDLSKFERVLFVVAVGDLGTNATVDFVVQESDAAGGSYANLAGKAITQLTQAGSDADKQALVEVKADELSEGKRYVRGRLTIGVAACDAAILALAGDPRNCPVTNVDLATVDEIVR
jgi:hypothetical protein